MSKVIAVLGLWLFVAFIIAVAAFVNGVIILLAWNAFHLNDLVAINYLQASGMAFILGYFSFAPRISETISE